MERTVQGRSEAQEVNLPCFTQLFSIWRGWPTRTFDALLASHSWRLISWHHQRRVPKKYRHRRTLSCLFNNGILDKYVCTAHLSRQRRISCALFFANDREDFRKFTSVNYIFDYVKKDNQIFMRFLENLGNYGASRLRPLAPTTGRKNPRIVDQCEKMKGFS